MRTITVALLTLVLAAGPLASQGPGPVGQRGMARPAASVAEVKSQVTSAARRMGSEATKGMAIGFLAGFVGMEILGTKAADDEKSFVHMVAFCAGVVGAWVGYMIGRARD